MTTTFDTKYVDAIRTAKQRVEIGSTSVYLSMDRDGPVPLNKVTSVREGGTHRFDIATDIILSWTEEGLNFTVRFDLETREANGKSQYALVPSRVADVLAQLQSEPASQLKAILVADAAKVRAQADEYFGYAQRLYGDAALFDALSRE